jgi:hypothetical protein
MKRVSAILMMFVVIFVFANNSTVRGGLISNPDFETLCHDRVEGWSLFVDNNTGVLYYQYRVGNKYITDAYSIEDPNYWNIINDTCGN